MRQRVLTLALLAASSLFCAACDQEVVRFDFVAEDAQGSVLEGAVSISLQAEDQSSDDPALGQFEIRAATVGGEPASGIVLVSNGGAPGSPLPAHLAGTDVFIVILTVDTLPDAGVVTLLLVDLDGNVFDSDRIPAPFPALDHFETEGMVGGEPIPDQVSFAIPGATAPGQTFSGRLRRLDTSPVGVPAIPLGDAPAP